MKPIKSVTFRSPINREGSWGSSNVTPDAESMMDLFFNSDNTGFIEWTIEELDMAEDIGLWFEIGVDGTRTLTDYDGVMSFPEQAVDLLKSVGVIVPDEFDDRIQGEDK